MILKLDVSAKMTSNFRRLSPLPSAKMAAFLKKRGKDLSFALLFPVPMLC